MLSFDLMVNSECVGKFYATRRAKRQVGPNPTNVYDVTIVDSEGDSTKFTVEHQHQEGAWALVTAALLEYATAPVDRALAK